jgi:hypothetical protein
MSYFIVDVEADGEIIGKNSMVCFGVVKLTPELDKTFYGKTKPISEHYKPEALAVSGFNREEHLKFDDPTIVMKNFADWISENSVGKPILISDNNGFDASWINYYFHVYYGSNPFGWSSRRIGDLYCGMVKDTFAKWKFLRKTIHSHHPVDDAMGNAEALLKMKEMGLKISTK